MPNDPRYWTCVFQREARWLTMHIGFAGSAADFRQRDYICVTFHGFIDRLKRPCSKGKAIVALK